MRFALKEALARRGMSQYRLAKQLGVAVGTVYLWANGKGMPKPSNVARIAEIIQADMNELWVHESAS